MLPYLVDRLFGRTGLIEEAQKLIMEPLERVKFRMARGCSELEGLSNQMAQSRTDG